MVREKYRYVVFSAHTGKALSSYDIYKSIEKYASASMSDWEYAMTIPKLKVAEYYPTMRIGIVKVLLSGLPNIRKLLTSPLKIKEESVMFSVIKVSGIIKKAKQWIIETEKKKKN